MGEPNMGRAEPFRGQASDVCYSQSPWFNCDEIPAERWDGYTVQIEEVRKRTGVKFNSGKARDVELFLKFVGIEKELRVNVTIRRVLDDILGPSCAAWFGRWITLFVQAGVKVGPETKNGVRVRRELPSPPKAEPERAAAPQAAAKPSGPLADAASCSTLARLFDSLAALALEAGIAAAAGDVRPASARFVSDRHKIDVRPILVAASNGTASDISVKAASAAIEKCIEAAKKRIDATRRPEPASAPTLSAPTQDDARFDSEIPF